MVVSGKGVNLGGGFELTGLVVDGLQQPAATGEASEREIFGEAEFADPVIGLAGIVVDGEGGKRRSHPAGAWPWLCSTNRGAPLGISGLIWT